jgi:type II secretory pathway pseudopilin PulG
MDARKPRRVRDIRRSAARLREERAFAVPTVLLMMLAAFAVVSVGVMAASNTQRGTVRDQNSKAALQLAEAGINEAMLRYNHLTPAAGNLCSPLGVFPANGWCQVGPVPDPSGGTYSYQVYVGTGSALPEDDQGNLELRVVGTGTMGETTRRVMNAAKSFSTNVFADYQVKAGEDIVLDGNASINAGTAAGGDITLNNNASLCGPASVGVVHNLHQNQNSGHFSDTDCQQPTTDVGHEDINLPLVSVPLTNENTRLFGQDPVSAVHGNNARACWNGFNADGTTGTCGARHLDIGNASAVTLGGSQYVFCKLTTNSNSSLLVSGGRKVVIYFDSPESCGYPSGTAQLDMNSNSRITSSEATPVELRFAGSTTRQTILRLSANTDANAECQQNMIVYAPLSDVLVNPGSTSNNGTTYCGALAGKSITLGSNAHLRVNGDYDLTLQPAIPYYQPDEFVECRAAPATAPTFDAGC